MPSRSRAPALRLHDGHVELSRWVQLLQAANVAHFRILPCALGPRLSRAVAHRLTAHSFGQSPAHAANTVKQPWTGHRQPRKALRTASTFMPRRCRADDMILVEFVRSYDGGAPKQKLQVQNAPRVAHGWPNHPRFSAFGLPMPDRLFRLSRDDHVLAHCAPAARTLVQDRLQLLVGGRLAHADGEAGFHAVGPQVRAALVGISC